MELDIIIVIKPEYLFILVYHKSRTID